MTVVDTRACRMTPEGRGAIATVLVWGPQAIACVAQQFQSRSGITLESAPAGRILFGMWSSNATPSQEVVSEEVVVCQTENDQVEVHCHGGHAAANAILAVLRTRGCRIVEWTDLPAMDRIQQDVRRALAVARTETVAAILTLAICQALLHPAPVIERQNNAEMAQRRGVSVRRYGAVFLGGFAR